LWENICRNMLIVNGLYTFASPQQHFRIWIIQKLSIIECIDSKKKSYAELLPPQYLNKKEDISKIPNGIFEMSSFVKNLVSIWLSSMSF
jgi:hypothetical protein